MVIDYFKRLIDKDLVMVNLSKKRLCQIEKKLLNECQKLSSLDQILFNIAFITDKPSKCTYVATNAKNRELQHYAELKANLMYFEESRHGNMKNF